MEQLRSDFLQSNDKGSGLAINASIVIGMVSFALAMWGIPDAFRLLISLIVGAVAGLLTFCLVLVYRRNFVFDYEDDEESVEDDKPAITAPKPDFEGKDENLLSKNHLTLSVNSPSNYEKSSKKPSEKVKKPPFPKEWSGYLIRQLEWRVFDRLCVSFWRAQGNSIADFTERSQDGIDFFIGAKGDRQHRVGVVQTRSAFSVTPTVDDMRSLLRLQRKNKLPVAALMYAGKLSNVTHSFCLANGIRLIDSDSINKGLFALPEKEQQHLLKSLVRPDYMIPSCPSCLVKLVKRQHKKTGRLFWGCISYPECRFTLA